MSSGMSTGVPAASASSCAWQRALHRDERPHRGVDGVADGEQAVVAEDHGLVVAERRADALALLEVEHHAGEVVEERVVLEERARVLGDRIEQAAERRPRLAVQRVRVRGGDHVGTRRVHLRVDRERGAVHQRVALDHRRRVWSTQIRSDTRMCLKFIPNGFTQKRSRCSGSRTVMWPATPSSKPNLPKRRNDAASRCLRCSRSSSTESKLREETRGREAVQSCREILGAAGDGSLRAQRLGRTDAGGRPGRQRPRAGWRGGSPPGTTSSTASSASGGHVHDGEVVGEPSPQRPPRDDPERDADDRRRPRR